MSKQQVTNTWKDGLNSDLNPMITPNTVLTDNLNGTLITYNGNEFSLQNDMGNRREGQLTEDFYPIGIAENSGILYIASIKEEPIDCIKINKPNFDSSDIIFVRGVFNEYDVDISLADVYSIFTVGLEINSNWDAGIYVNLGAQYIGLFSRVEKSVKFEIGSFPSLDPSIDIETEHKLDYQYRPFNNLLLSSDSYIILMDTSSISNSQYVANRLISICSYISWFTEKDARSLFNGSIAKWSTTDKDKWIELRNKISEILDECRSHWPADITDPYPTMFYTKSLVPFSTYELSDYSREYPVTIEVQPSYDGSVNLILNDNTQPPRLINSAFAVTGGGNGKFIKRHFGSRTNYYEEDKLDIQTRLIQNSTKFTYIDLGDGENGDIDGVQTGGELKGGNYTFYLKYGDADGNKTDIICESGIISVFNGTPGDPSSMTGTLADELTDKFIWLTVNDIDTDYSKIYLSYTREYSDTNGYRLVEAKELVEPYTINDSKERILINGLEVISDISIEDLNIKYYSISGAKAITQQQSMLFLGNVHSKEIDAEELQDISYKIRVTLKSGDKNLGYVSPKDYKSHYTKSDLGEFLCRITVVGSMSPSAARNNLYLFLVRTFPGYSASKIADMCNSLWDNGYYKDSYSIIKTLYSAIVNINPTDTILNWISFKDVSMNTLNTEVSSDTPSEYYDPKNIYYNLGYWPGDYYRFGVIYIKNDGTSTDVFDLKGCHLRDIDDDNYNEVYHKTDCTDLEDNTFLRGTQSLDNIKGVFKLYEQVGRIPVISNTGITPYYLRFEFNDEDPTIINRLNKLGIIGYQIVRQKRIPSIICQGYSIGVSKNAFIPMLYNNYDQEEKEEEGDKIVIFKDVMPYYKQYNSNSPNDYTFVTVNHSYKINGVGWWYNVHTNQKVLELHDQMPNPNFQMFIYLNPYMFDIDVSLPWDLHWLNGMVLKCIDPNLPDQEWAEEWDKKEYYDGGGVVWSKNRFDQRSNFHTSTESVLLTYDKFKYLKIECNDDASKIKLTFFNDVDEYEQSKFSNIIKPYKYFTESFITNKMIKNNAEIEYSRNLYNTYGGGLSDGYKRAYIVQLEYLTNLYKNYKTAVAADAMMASGEPTIGTIGAIMRLTNQWSKSAHGLAVVTYVSNEGGYEGPQDSVIQDNLPSDTTIYDCIVYVVRYATSKKGNKAQAYNKALEKCIQYCEDHKLLRTEANQWTITLSGWPISEYDGEFKNNGYIYEVSRDPSEKYPKGIIDMPYNSNETSAGYKVKERNFAHENYDAWKAQNNASGLTITRYKSTDNIFSNAFGVLSPEVTVSPELQSKLNGNKFELNVVSEPNSPLYYVPGTNYRLFSSEQISVFKYNTSDDSSSDEELASEKIARVLYIPRDTALKTINFGQDSLSLVSASTLAGSASDSKEFRFLENRPKPNTDDDEDRDDVVRGQYTDFLLIADSTSRYPGSVVNVCVPDTTDGKNDILRRANNNAEYYVITNKIPLTEGIDTYRGDCYTNTVTVRMHKNFIDPTAPISDVIVDRTAWKNYYKGLYNVNTDPENIDQNKTQWDKINISDLNTVDLGHWITFKCLANCNLALRSEDTSNVSEYALLGKPRSFYPHEGISTATASKTLDTTLFNHGYDATVSRVRYSRKEHTPYDMNEFGTRIMFSNVDIISSFQNEYRIFQGMSYKDYPTTYGDIIKLLPWGQNLFCVFEHGIAIIPVNPKALMNTTTEDTIHIYGYGVLPEDVSVISQDFGSIWADSVIRTPLGIYGVDTSAKKIWQYTDTKGLVTISDMKVQRFLNDHINIGLKSQEKLGETNVKTHYNMYKGDVIFTFYNTDDKEHYEEWSLCYNERQGLWITRYSWTPLLSANVNNTFYSIELRRYENAAAKASKTEENRPFGIWKHGRTGVDKLILPTKWYGVQEPFEFEFVAGEPMGIDKIFENLKITSNNVQPESFDFQIIGDDYLFNKARIYESIEDEYANYYEEPKEYGNIPYASAQKLEGQTVSSDNKLVKDDLYLEKTSEEPEAWEPRADYSPAFYNASLTYDKVLDEYILVVHQDCKNKQAYGIRRGNIQYKENGWDTNIEPLRYNPELKNPNKDFDKIRDDYETPNNFVSAKLRDKWLKVRIKYKGDRLAIIGAVTTVENISYA